VALTVLDFGRTTFGASCTGAAKVCLELATCHAARRRQFGRPLADLELVKKKLAFLAASAYAMEATTYETAALIDRGAEDYMLETAILKVSTTEMLWHGVYETLQVHGGQGYFSDEPFERMMRDARINTIGEGANEVLKAFIALVGMRSVGEGLKATMEGLRRPTRVVPTLWRFGRDRLLRAVRTPLIPIATPALRPAADLIARRILRFARAVEGALIKHREAILEMQYVQERIADAAIALVTASCTLARLDRALAAGTSTELDRASGTLYLRVANRRFDQALWELAHNEDPQTTAAAAAALHAFSGR
jgi:alkylation response protein AidB-like acyl-CoA dehydrogenase